MSTTDTPTIRTTADMLAEAPTPSQQMAIPNGLFRDVIYALGSVRGVVVSAMDFGAAGNGTANDQSKLQAAINAVSAAGGGVVLLPPHSTFLLAGPVGGDGYTLLTPKTGVSVIGSGPTSVIKVANGIRTLTTGIGVLYDNANPLSDITYRDFTLDYNGQNNLNLEATGGHTATANINRLGGGAGCTNIVIERVNFKNAAGHHFVMLAGGGSRCRIVNNTFNECGLSITSNGDTDHSSIYLQADESEISGNTFINANPDTVATAFETHGSKLRVHDNYALNYASGSNIGAQVANTTDVDYHDNTYRNVLKGIVLWTSSAFLLSRVKIHDNTFGLREATGGPPPGRGINAPATTMVSSVNGSHLSIQDNEFFSETLAQLTVTTVAIELRRWNDVLIDGNKIHDLMGEALIVSSESIPRTMSRLTIVNNDIRDVGLTSTAANKRGLALLSLSNAAQTVDTISIRNNTLTASASPAGGTTAVTGIEFGTGWFPNTRITGNTIVGFTTQPIKKGTTDAANLFYIEGEGAFAPVNSNMKASLGSKWTDSTASPFKMYVGADTANDGTSAVWTVISPDRLSADNGDAAKVLTDGDERYQWWNTALTAARDVNLPAASQANRYRVFHITRGLSCTGAFNLNVKDSGGSLIKALTAAGQTAMFVSNGAAYRHVSTGTL